MRLNMVSLEISLSRKHQSSTIEDIARALKELYKADNKIKIIGTRHGEKLFESLVNREEMAKAHDLSGYYRIPADARDLNYNMYFSEGKDKVSVRAWQGHQKENKFFYVTKGDFLICAVRIDDWDNPSKNLPIKVFNLSDRESNVLVLPGGYANGIQANSEHGQLIVFSDKSLNESKDDDFRYPADWWYDWNILNE